VDGLNDEHGAIAILDIGGMHLGADQQTASISHNVALTPFDLLGRIVTSRPAALGSLDRLTERVAIHRRDATGFTLCVRTAPQIWKKAGSH
jgi:hypothetical protein